MQRFIIAMSLVTVLILTGCSTRSVDKASGSPTQESSQSVDASAALSGVWVPSRKDEMTRLEFTADGVLKQRLSDPKNGVFDNAGEWALSAPGQVTCTLQTLGFGTPVVVYDYTVDGETLSLKKVSGHSWVTGESDPDMTFQRQ